MTRECAVCGATSVPLKHGPAGDLLCPPCLDISRREVPREPTTGILDHALGHGAGDPDHRRGRF